MSSAEPIGIPDEPVRRLTVEQYRAMARTGILTPEDGIELLEGWLVEKMTKSPRHRIATRRVRVALEGVVPAGWYVDSQEPIAAEDSEPEPDAAVIRGKSEDYIDENPAARHVGLVAEVSDASLSRDRGTKARIYARAGIPEYWLVNLLEHRVEVFTEPGASGYRHTRSFSPGDRLPVILEGAEIGAIAVESLLPPA